MMYTRDISEVKQVDERLEALADTYANLHTIIKLAIGIRHIGRPTNEEYSAWDAGLEESCKKLEYIAAEYTALCRTLRGEE
jgi:hypothetical protein